MLIGLISIHGLLFGSSQRRQGHCLTFHYAIDVLQRQELESKAMDESMKLPGNKVLHLKPFKPEKIIELVCTLLGVDELPREIKGIIHEKTLGIPLFTKELVESILEQNVLDFHPVRTYKKLNRILMLSTLNENASLSDIPILESVSEMILAKVNHLPTTEPLTTKYAAVIGTTFTKSVLKGIIPKQFESTFADSIRLLQASGIIQCALAEAYRKAIDDGNEDQFLENQNLYCPCLEHIKYCKSDFSIHDSKDVFNDEKILDQCELLQFSDPIIQEVIYGLWTEKQCVQLHKKAAQFLESQVH